MVLLLLFSSGYTEQYEKMPLIYSSKKIWDDTVFSRAALVTQTAISAAVIILSFLVMKVQKTAVDQLINMTALLTMNSFDNILYFVFKITLDREDGHISK